ncbi:MAG: hypothetical protein ACFFEM_00950, partial [Candidatus Thorarchaeota archaeon]
MVDNREVSPSISVITPIHTANHKLQEIRKVLSSSTHPTELIIVINNPELIGQIESQSNNEKVVIASRKGRGFAFLKGITNITGLITLLLHSDTIPPVGWDNAILSALED